MDDQQVTQAPVEQEPQEVTSTEGQEPTETAEPKEETAPAAE